MHCVILKKERKFVVVTWQSICRREILFGKYKFNCICYECLNDEYYIKFKDGLIKTLKLNTMNSEYIRQCIDIVNNHFNGNLQII